MYWKAGPGKKVGIIGLGGLGHIGVKMALHLVPKLQYLATHLKNKKMEKEWEQITSMLQQIQRL